MQPAIVVALLSILFFATHIGLATSRIRSALVARMGEGGFVNLYSLVASALFIALFVYYAAHRYDVPGGLALGRVEAVRWVLIGTITAGFMLLAGSLVTYPESPYGVLGHTFREPRGLERITRHGFFMGTFLLTASHTLLAAHLTGTIVFGSLALLSVIGARHQDFKLLSRGGEAHAQFLATTSMIPFGAIISGRQHIDWKELPIRAMLIGLGVAFVLRAIHQRIFAYGGLLAVAVVIGGAAILGQLSWMSSRRPRLSSNVHNMSEPERGM